jgi:hypothetical protein
LTRDTPLREKISLANRRFITMKMTSKMHRKIKSIRKSLKEKRACRAVIFRTMENPDSSTIAWIIHKLLITSVMCSIMLFCLQSTTELNKYGQDSKACAHQFQTYCNASRDRWEGERNALSDPACFEHEFKDNSSNVIHHYGANKCANIDRKYLVDLTSEELDACKTKWRTGENDSDGILHRYYDFPTNSGDSPFCFSCDDRCKYDFKNESNKVVVSDYNSSTTNSTNSSIDTADSTTMTTTDESFGRQPSAYYPKNIPGDKYVLPEQSMDILIDPEDQHKGSYTRSFGFRTHDPRDYMSYNITFEGLDPEPPQTVERSEDAYKDFPRIYPICLRPQCIDNEQRMTLDMSSSWFYLELAFNIFFTLELILKLVVYPDLSQWFLGTDALVNGVDVVAVIPFWLEIFVSFSKYGYIYSEPMAGEVSVVKFLRMLAVLRVFKLVRNFDGAAVITQTVQSAWSRLILPLFYLLVFVVVFGCIVYTIENQHNLGADQPFPEMLTACWFVLVTMTTTGYGKVVPTKIPTKLVAIVVMIAGNFYMAMPLTIGKFAVCLVVCLFCCLLF